MGLLQLQSPGSFHFAAETLFCCRILAQFIPSNSQDRGAGTELMRSRAGCLDVGEGVLCFIGGMVYQGKNTRLQRFGLRLRQEL